jgi:hypothetical protein
VNGSSFCVGTWRKINRTPNLEASTPGNVKLWHLEAWTPMMIDVFRARIAFSVFLSAFPSKMRMLFVVYQFLG